MITKTLCTAFVQLMQSADTFYTVSQKILAFKLLITLSFLTDFQTFCTAEKRMKFATKPIRHYSSHLKHVAIVPLEIRNSNFLQVFSRYGRNANKLHFSRLKLQCLSTIDMVFNDENKILIKSLYLKGLVLLTQD